MNYYNEHDPKAAAWLRELIKQNQIPAGHVDERSIVEIQPHELAQYTQCHFFAGIGGWSYALQLAGIPSTQSIWTGSCPCQPFSTAGNQKGQQDERHLWPAFFNLIRECRPQYVFGEQVANAIRHGWLDGISADLEAEEYTCGAAVLGAHSVGAPHIRQRLYWMAFTRHMRRRNRSKSGRQELDEAARCSEDSCGVDDSKLKGLEGLGKFGGSSQSDGCRKRIIESAETSSQAFDGLGVTNCNRRGSRSAAASTARHRHTTDSASGWSGAKHIECLDGKLRRIPTEPAFSPLAHGIPARVVRLRGYGNAIVPQTAAAFIQASFEALNDPLLGVW